MIQKIANEMKIMAKATIVIGIGKTVVLEGRIHTIKANFYKSGKIKAQNDVPVRSALPCNGYTRRMRFHSRLYHE